MIIPGETFSELYQRLARVRKTTRFLTAAARVANEALNDHETANDVVTQGQQLLKDLKAIEETVAGIEETLALLDGRGLHRATVDTLKEKQSRLAELIAAKTKEKEGAM